MTSNFSTTISHPSFEDFDDDDAESDNEIYSEIIKVIKKTEFPISTSSTTTTTTTTNATTHSDDFVETLDPVFPLWSDLLENQIFLKILPN